jgi:uncharacterized membrane protein
MTVILFNLIWMPFNMLLALIGVILGWLMYKTKPILFKYLLAFLWLLFVPNTIYILTDAYHLTYQWFRVPDTFKLLLFLEYIILLPSGVITYLWSMYYFEKTISKLPYKHAVIIIINIAISFGIMLGRFQRTHSWYVFTDPARVWNDVIGIFQSINLFIIFVIFSICLNMFYWYARKSFSLYTFTSNTGHKKRLQKKRLAGMKLPRHP